MRGRQSATNADEPRMITADCVYFRNGHTRCARPTTRHTSPSPPRASGSATRRCDRRRARPGRRFHGKSYDASTFSLEQRQRLHHRRCRRLCQRLCICCPRGISRDGRSRHLCQQTICARCQRQRLCQRPCILCLPRVEWRHASRAKGELTLRSAALLLNRRSHSWRRGNRVAALALALDGIACLCSR